MNERWSSQVRPGPADAPGSALEGIGDRVCSDLIDRWQRGERVPVEAYLRQHPELADDDAVFELVLTEVVLRKSFGEPAALDEYLWRFPQFGERLQRHFALHSELTQLHVSSSEGGPPARPVCFDGEAPVVPGYEIIGELGRGGMGIVYEARESRLERTVALKFLPLSYAHDRVRMERFLREARTASALNHPHICTVHALGEHAGRQFIVMERIEGVTFKAWMNRGGGMEEIVRLLGQVAEALAAAHAEGVVHRDIKPENIMVRDDGYVKVLDFGLARHLPTLSANPAGGEDDTAPGALLGTVAYMSPEQTSGLPADSASDVFALGIVLYQAATGRHPFEGETPLATLQAIASCPAVPASRLRPDVPKALESLIEGMLHKDGRLRPTAATVSDALSAIFRHGGVRSVHPVVRPVVPRAHELSRLRSSFRDAAAGRGALVCLAGEPGIGKTTLAESFLESLPETDHCLVARGRCSERLAETEAYFPVLDALGDLLRGDASGSAARLMKFVAPTWYAQISRTGGSVSIGGDSERSRAGSGQAMLREFCTFLEEASRLAPVVLFFDDIHWADLPTVDLLGHFGRFCTELRVLVVVSYRRTEMLLGPHAFNRVRQELQARGSCTELVVGFLAREDVDEYLSLVFSNHSFPEDFADLIFARTEGSPLFMSDLLRDLQSRGVIAQSDGRWVLARALPDLHQEMPASVRSMISRLLERLEPEERRLLAAASVQGHQFDSVILADVLQLDAADVEERLQELDRIHGLVRRVREFVFPDRSLAVRYAFVHVLYQQALYTEMAPNRRAALSTSLAGALERRHLQAPSVAAELACLYEVGRDFARAARQFHLAAKNSAYLFAHHEATALARRGLGLLEMLPESDERDALELALQTTLGMQLQVTHGFAAQEARQAYVRARALCGNNGDPAALFPVLWGLWLYSKVRSELSRAQEMANELQELSTRLQNPGLALQAHQALGMTAFCRGLPAVAVQHVEQVSTLYDAERHRAHSFMFGQDPAVICKAYGAVSLWLLGFADQAQRQSDEAVRMSRGLSPSSQAVALHFSAMLHQLRRDARRAVARARESTSIAAEHGFSFWLAGGNVLLGWGQVAEGGAKEGIEVLRRGLRDWMATDSVTYQTYFLGLLCEALSALHRSDDGLKVLDEALTLVDHTGEGLFHAELLRLRGELLVKVSDLAGGEESFQQAIQAARGQQAAGLEFRACISAARLARDRGRVAEARGILGPIVARQTEGFDTDDYRTALALL